MKKTLLLVLMVVLMSVSGYALNIDVVGENADGGIRNGHNVTDDLVSTSQQLGQTFNINGTGTYTLDNITTRLKVNTLGVTPVRASIYEFNGSHPLEPVLAYVEINGSLINESPERYKFSNISVVLNYAQTYMLVLSSDDPNTMSIIGYYNNTGEYTNGNFYQNPEDLGFGWQLAGGNSNLDFLLEYTDNPAPPINATPYIQEFSTLNASILNGSSTTLSWIVINSTNTTIDGVGEVNNTGSLLVTPSSNTTYKLNATNLIGLVNANLTINVYYGCVPAYYCSSYQTCNPLNVSNCTAVSDTNLCGVPYNPLNLSDYNTNCTYTPPPAQTGYNNQYNPADMGSSVIDLIVGIFVGLAGLSLFIGTAIALGILGTKFVFLKFKK